MSSIEEKINRLWDYLLGFFACWIIGIGSRLNLFEAIKDCKNGISAKELAERLKLDYHLINIWCKAAYSFELLDLDEGGNFRIANSMDSFLINSPNNYSLAGAIENYVGASESFFHFYEAFKTGKAFNLEDMGELYSNSVERATLTIPNYIISYVLPIDPCLKNLADKKAKILDFGCGTGLGMIQYAKIFNNWNFLGVDIDQGFIHKAEEYIKNNGLEDRIKVKFIPSDKLNVDKDFDLILLTFTFHEIKNKQDLLKELFKILKKDGNLLIVELSLPDGIAELRDFSGRIAMGAQMTEALQGNTLISTSEMKELLRIANYRNVREYETDRKIFKIYIAQK